MKRIEAFFYVFIKSVSSLKYYEEVVKTSTAFSMKYFFILALLASIIATVGILVPNLPTINKEVKNVLDQTKNVYPANLAITVKEGKLSINQPEPYFIPMPKALTEADNATQNIPTHIIVFDSKGTIDDVTKYNTLILVNQTNVLVKTEGKIEANPIGEIPDGTVTRADVDNLFVTLENYAKYVPHVLAAIIFIGMVFYYGVFRLVYLLIVGGTLWIAGRVRELNFGYDKYFKIAIHTFTVPLVVDLVVKITGVTLTMPYWFFVINVIFGIVVLLSLHKSQKEAN